MSLQVWLPLNKNVIENKGLSDVTITNNGATFVDAGIESCYQIVGQQITFPTTNLQFMEMKPGKTFSVAFWINGVYSDSWLIACDAWEIQFRTTLISVYPGSSDSGRAAKYLATINNNQWYHLAFTWDGISKILTLYVNGDKKGESTFTTDFSLSSTFNLVYNYTRKMCDFRIYDHDLSDKEVAELAKGLMFHLKLDNTDLYDCSGFNQIIVATGGTGALTNQTNTSRYSKSLNFNNSFIKVKEIIPSGAEQFSFSFWINPSVNQTSCIWNGRTTAGAAIAIFYINGGIRFDDDSQAASSATAISLNVWTHVVCTYMKGGRKKIYINGENKLSAASSTITKSNTQASIGMSLTGDGTPSGNPLSGNLSDFRIYRTALTDEQVAELYKVGGSIDNHGNAHCYEICEDKENYFLALSRNDNTTNNLAYTFDSGKNWNYKNINCPNTVIRVSQNLKTWTITGYGESGNGWYSLDFGETLNQLPVKIEYATVSNGGNVIAGCISNTKKTYRLVAPFTSYETIYTATQSIWTMPTVNYDGSLIIGRTNSNLNAWKYDNGTTSIIFSGSTTMNQPDIAATSNIIYLKTGTYLYRSNDKGTTWTTLYSNLDSTISFDASGSISVSNTGEYFIMHAIDNNKIAIFWNYGEKYRIFNTNGTRVNSSCSSSGRYMCYTVDMNVFISTDYGQSFHQITTPTSLTPSGNLTSVTIEDADEYEIIKNS